MTTAKRTQPNVLEVDVALAAVVVVVVGWDVVVVACGRVVVVAGRVVVVVGEVVGGTVVVVVGATVVVVTGALVVVVVSWAAALPDRTPSRTRRGGDRQDQRGCVARNLRMHPSSLWSRAGAERGPWPRPPRIPAAKPCTDPRHPRPEDDMQLDIHVPRFTWPGGPAAIGPTFASLAQTAEAIGVRTLSVMDHWFQMEMLWPAEEPMLEGYTALSFAAAKTERLRFRLLVGGVTYRHPGLLAKTITTLDVLSGGRAELGLGAAWYEREHLGLGVPFPPLRERYERLEETLQICFQMWSDDNGPYEGLHYQLAETLCSPQPVSSPRPRVLIGGGGERKTLRLVAIYADACNIIGDVETVTHKVGVLRRHCDDVGRDFAQIEVTALIGVADDAGPDTILREAQALHDAGVHAIVIRAAGPEPTQWLEETWGPVVPSLAALG